MQKLPSNGSKNPVIGAIRCPVCNGVATVHQTRRKGQHLYTHCGNCGIDQKTGQPFQAYIKKSMVDDVENLPDKAPPFLGLEPTEVTEPEPNLPTEPEPNLPTEVTKPEPNLPTEPEPKTDRNNTPLIVGGILVFLALVGGLIALFKPKADSN